MKRIAALLFVALLLLVPAPRLPAPISEENPTPVPEQSAKPKRKPRAESVSKKTGISPFAGTWLGSSVGLIHCSEAGDGVTKDSGKMRSFRVSGDGKTADGYPTFLSGDGKTLTWRFQHSYTTTYGISHAASTCTLQLVGPKLVREVEEHVFTDGPQTGCVSKFTGTYAKQ